MKEAAIALATSQDPWAETVECSPQDFYMLGFWDVPYVVMQIRIEEDISFEEPELPLDPSYVAGHKIIVRPSDDIPVGWVELP